MQEKEWIEKARKLLEAIKFNVEHPSKDRDIIGGLELGLIHDLLEENLTKHNNDFKKPCPKCGGETYIKEISSGGDDLMMCLKCDWVEDLGSDFINL